MGKYSCDECNGTGKDEKATLKARESGICDKYSYVRCWACNGNGIDILKLKESNHESATSF